MSHPNRYTVYDMMEKQGAFKGNPANQFSTGAGGESIYRKQEFPVMLYHPEGQELVTQPSETVITAYGPKETNEKRQLVHLVAHNPRELEHLLGQGWHREPADSIEASGKPRPAVAKPRFVAQFGNGAADDALSDLKEQMRQLMERLALAEARGAAMEQLAAASATARAPEPGVDPALAPLAALTGKAPPKPPGGLK